MASVGKSLDTVGLTLSHGDGRQIRLLKDGMALQLPRERFWAGLKGVSARALEVDDHGDMVIVGSTVSGGRDEEHVLLQQHGPASALHWHSVWGGPRQEAIHCLALYEDFACLAGNTRSDGEVQAQDLLIKADSRGSRSPSAESQFAQ